MGPEGGRASSRWRRIVDCSSVWRSDGELVDWSATAPTIQAIPSPTHAVNPAPSTPSTFRRPGSRSADRARIPTPSNPLASTPPASSAPTSPNSAA